MHSGGGHQDNAAPVRVIAPQIPGEGWDGERVKAWSDACQVVKKYAEPPGVEDGESV